MRSAKTGDGGTGEGWLHAVCEERWFGGGGWLQRRACILRSRARTDAGLDHGPAFQNDAATLAFVASVPAKHPALVVNDVAGFCEGLRR